MNKPLPIPNADLQEVLQEFICDLIDSCLMDDILIMHRAIKLGYFHIIAAETNPDSTDNSDFGTSKSSSSRNSNKTTNYCRCGKCNSKVAATRYAAHLANCMGLGRNSWRQANKRIAEHCRLEDSDAETEENLLKSSSGDMVTNKSAETTSDRVECRYSNKAISRHQLSPLKPTNSLVSNGSSKRRAS
ncbi:unnamed protein product [Trichobilharzia regenti]|uniref:SAGA-associated factor 11 n=1 Tax=Trichobilharzia regenti TaxID=157069 RepID=A0A183VU66_TRIRE|nr:unnamed protein product [Trichobilharzia regenti]VDP99901.1 unnamed protein product [Trichobilharzia regenti]